MCFAATDPDTDYRRKRRYRKERVSGTGSARIEQQEARRHLDPKGQMRSNGNACEPLGVTPCECCHAHEQIESEHRHAENYVERSHQVAVIPRLT